MAVSIEQVDNGYVMTTPHTKEVFHELEEICQALLGHFEGRSPGLEGKFYGVVIIHREATVQKSHAGVGIVKSTQMRAPLTIPDDSETPAAANSFFVLDEPTPEKET
mgnify:FL=1